MHLPPEVWGPIVWSTLHLVAMGYSDTPSYAEKRAAKEFYNSMAYLLPCPVCREHFTEILSGIPVENWLDNRKSLIEWTVMAHNRVNEKLGKPQITMEQFYKKYTEMAKRGLPIPPANATADIDDGLQQEAYVRGMTHTIGALIVIGSIGGLLWASYK